jgi:hypothetical protein
MLRRSRHLEDLQSDLRLAVRRTWLHRRHELERDASLMVRDRPARADRHQQVDLAAVVPDPQLDRLNQPCLCFCFRTRRTRPGGKGYPRDGRATGCAQSEREHKD